MPWVDVEHPSFVTEGLPEMVELHKKQDPKQWGKCKGVYFAPTVGGFFFKPGGK